ncbi:MAG: PLP-dependent aminotransferase family protein [Acidobacteria bacterium]|nr:PLP-dependent aminotransferase family protein [Acidobacteriota bacterium]MBI3427372.1 PLP-dependent aminotransferase family protein [Acidobacteriota bacterium]
MIFELDRQSHTPLYTQIAAQMRQMIRHGALNIGDRLPPNRELAQTLGVNRSTVATAYDELLADGLIAARVGSGTYVAAVPITSLRAQPETVAPAPPRLAPLNWEAVLPELKVNEFLASREALRRKDSLVFTHALPAAELFPLDEFRRSVERVLRRDGRALLQYGASGGYEALQQYLQQQMALVGIRAEPDEMLLTSGCQQALDLLRQTLLQPGDEVIVENPTYPGALSLFCQPQYKCIGVPVDAQGLNLNALEEVLQRRRPKLIYVVPTFHNPTGVTMDLAARRRLLELAAQYRVPLVEDEIYRDLRYEGAALPSLKALDQYGVVIYLNSFSKVSFPGLRVGWVVAPRLLIEHLQSLRQRTDMHGNLLSQAALADFARQGLLNKHLQRCRRNYVQRRDALLTSLGKHLPTDSTWTQPEGGLAVWVRLPEGVNAEMLLAQAQLQNIYFTPGTRFYACGARTNTLRLSFTMVTAAQIEEGVKRLGKLIEVQLKTMSPAHTTKSLMARKALV